MITQVKDQSTEYVPKLILRTGLQKRSLIMDFKASLTQNGYDGEDSFSFVLTM